MDKPDLPAPPKAPEGPAGSVETAKQQRPGWFERNIFNKTALADDPPPVAYFRHLGFEDFPQGRVLEVGIGTGLTLNHYPQFVQELWTLTLAATLAKEVDQRAAARGMTIHHSGYDGVTFPFPDNSFDVVVMHQTLCSVGKKNVPIVLAEVARVLKPGGQYRFLEHVPTPKEAGSRTLRGLVSPFNYAFGGGCRISSEPRGEMASAGFVMRRHFEGIEPGVAWLVRNAGGWAINNKDKAISTDEANEANSARPQVIEWARHLNEQLAAESKAIADDQRAQAAAQGNEEAGLLDEKPPIEPAPPSSKKE